MTPKSLYAVDIILLMQRKSKCQIHGFFSVRHEHKAVLPLISIVSFAHLPVRSLWAAGGRRAGLWVSP